MRENHEIKCMTFINTLVETAYYIDVYTTRQRKKVFFIYIHYTYKNFKINKIQNLG